VQHNSILHDHLLELYFLSLHLLVPNAMSNNACKFTEFMDGQELREAILQEVSGEGPPYEVEVFYDGDGEMFFKGGWPRFTEDCDLH
jgi:hypothetical protein